MLSFKSTDRRLQKPYESLRTSSIACRYLLIGGRDRWHSSGPVSLEKATELVRRRAMAFIVLTTVAGAFYVFVLIHWIRDTKRRAITRFGAKIQTNQQNCEPKRPITIGIRETRRGPGRLTARSLRPASVKMRSGGSDLCCRECERNVYEAIARSWSMGRKI